MVLVTGGSGFIGSAISSMFGSEAIRVDRQFKDTKIDKVFRNNITADLTSAKCAQQLEKDLSQYNITHIIHTAGVTPWSENPDYSKDIKMAETIAKLGNTIGVDYFYYLSGWIVYEMTNKEISNSEKLQPNPTTDYGISKYKVEQYLQKKLVHSKLVNLRLASIYGPGQRSPGLLPNFVKESFKDGQITLGAKETRRDYLYINDFLDVIMSLFNKGNLENMDLNVGSGKSHSVSEVAQVIKRILKKEYGIDVVLKDSNNLRESTPLDNQLSIEKAEMLGLFNKHTSLEAGLKAYIAWGISESIF